MSKRSDTVDQAHALMLTRLIDALIVAVRVTGVDDPLLNHSIEWQAALAQVDKTDFDSIQLYQLHALSALIDKPAVLVALVCEMYRELATISAPTFQRPIAA